MLGWVVFGKEENKDTCRSYMTKGHKCILRDFWFVTPNVQSLQTNYVGNDLASEKLQLAKAT